MKCPICGNENVDGSVFCANCGANMVNQAPTEQSTQPTPQSTPQPQQPPQGQYYPPVAYVDPADHTAEFDAKDIADNKVFAICAHLFGWMGILVALLAAKDSGFVKFHVKTAMKLLIAETLLVLIGLLLCWTIIVPIVAGLVVGVLSIIDIIVFVQACQGKAKDPAIIRSIGFLN